MMLDVELFLSGDNCERLIPNRLQTASIWYGDMAASAVSYKQLHHRRYAAAPAFMRLFGDAVFPCEVFVYSRPHQTERKSKHQFFDG